MKLRSALGWVGGQPDGRCGLRRGGYRGKQMCGWSVGSSCTSWGSRWGGRGVEGWRTWVGVGWEGEGTEGSKCVGGGAEAAVQAGGAGGVRGLGVEDMGRCGLGRGGRRGEEARVESSNTSWSCRWAGGRLQWVGNRMRALTWSSCTSWGSRCGGVRWGTTRCARPCG